MRKSFDFESTKIENFKDFKEFCNEVKNDVQNSNTSISGIFCFLELFSPHKAFTSFSGSISKFVDIQNFTRFFVIPKNPVKFRMLNKT